MDKIKCLTCVENAHGLKEIFFRTVVVSDEGHFRVIYETKNVI